MDRLVAYSGSSSESEEENRNDQTNIIPTKKPRLPCAENLLGAPMKVESDELLTNPELHQNRVRSFKHERGNWATFVYVPVDHDIFDEISELCQKELTPLIELYTCDDFHLTLSKTVVLQYHLIENFVKSLESAFTDTSFSAFLGTLNVYVNEDKTRTFIGLKVETPKLHDLLKKVDAVMRDFNLAVFYENPSFHISFAWCLGNKVDLIQAKLERLTTAMNVAFSAELLEPISIEKLSCKIGHKIYNFKLS